MYITYYLNTIRPHQITFEELYANFNKPPVPDVQQDPFKKFTAIIELTTENLPHYLHDYPIEGYCKAIKSIIEKPNPDALKEDMSSEYHTFQIPKHSGGFRTIEAPNDDLKKFQSELKEYFDNTCNALPHNAAYAYIKHREVKNALEKHRNSNWFLKLDVHGFFPSCNLEAIYSHIKQVFPFSVFPTDCDEALKTAIQYGLINDHLPQGTPMSPVLTNLMMVPFDTELSRLLTKEFIYTRYADDLLISSPYQFDWAEMQTKIVTLLKTLNYPFELNQGKTRYGSINGRNWNLGLMLNKDHQITLGHAKKQRYKAAIFNFCNDLTKGKIWDRIDVQVLSGQLAYGKNIEPEYFNNLIQKYNQKFQINFDAECKIIINS